MFVSLSFHISLFGLLALITQWLSHIKYRTECAVLEDYWHILYNLECETQFAPLLEPCVEDLGGLLKAFLSCLQDSAAGTDENIEEDSETRRFQLLCLPFCFLANLSDKGRHLLFDGLLIC